MEASKMRYSLDHLVFVGVLLLCCLVARGQTPNYQNVGRAPTEDEVRAWDISIGVDGTELPPGSGTAKQGALLYTNKCASCHGPNLEGSPIGRALVGGKGTLTTNGPVETIGSFWAYATSLWDYINRGMPLYQELTLTADQVYALTAYLLYRNDIIQESDVMDARSLPKVRMPNRDGFIPQRVEDIPDIQKRGCRAGHCPD